MEEWYKFEALHGRTTLKGSVKAKSKEEAIKKIKNGDWHNAVEEDESWECPIRGYIVNYIELQED